METRCLLCDRPIEAIGAIVVVGDVEHPENATLCRRCADLPPPQRRSLRNQAMLRALDRHGDVGQGSRSRR